MQFGSIPSGSSVWPSVSPVLFWPHCYSSGHAAMSRLPSRGTVQRNEHGFGHSFPRASISYTSPGRSRRSPSSSIFPFSCFLPASSFTYTMSIRRCLAPLPGGLGFAWPYTYASRSCQSFDMTVPTTHLSRHRPGASFRAHYSYFSELFSTPLSSSTHPASASAS